VIGGNQPPEPEDEIDRRLREITEEIGRGPVIREPSAAERAAGRGQSARRRDARAVRRAQRKAWGPRKRANPARAWLIAIVIFGIAGALTWARLGGSAKNPADDTKPVTNGTAPHVSASAPAGPPADPFTGSPADGYANGQAGIAVPAAHAIGSYPAAEVQAAYAETRKLLIASNLDPQTLHGGSPDALASQLIAQQRTFFVSELNKIGTSKQGYTLSTRGWVQSFAPGTTQFVSNTIKVHGMMSAAVAQDSGRDVLRVHADYLFVYAVEPPHEPADWMRIVDRNYSNVDFATWDDPGGQLEPWLSLWNGGGTAGARCGINDGFVHPAFPSGPPDKVKPSGVPINPYDQVTRPNFRSCHRTTRT
jgi:hypothetical protein